MSPATRQLPARTVLQLAVTAVLSSLASSATAESPFLLARFETTVDRPQMQFTSQTISGYGELVTEVEYGGKAYRLGIEAEDVILSVNGYRLSDSDAWDNAICDATLGEGLLTFVVRDGRTGRLMTRTTRLFFR